MRADFDPQFRSFPDAGTAVLAGLAGAVPASLPAFHDDESDPRDTRPFSARIYRDCREPAPVRRPGTRGTWQPGWRLACATLLLAMLVLAGWTLAFGTLAEAAEPQGANSLAVEPMPFEQPGQSFPGSAFYYLDASADTAPVPLPGAPLAADAHWDNAEHPATGTEGGTEGGMVAGPAARAIAQVGTGLDRTRALTCLTAAIYYEAASEPDAGQRAVAQVILNRVAHPAFPKTVCGVVYQGSERATGCQFTFTCDGSLARKPVALFWNRAESVARAALDGSVYAPVGLATHYHTFAVHPYWDASMNFIGQIGAHRFFRMQGPAGAVAAFRFAYAGGEPLTTGRLTHGTAQGNSPDPVAIERAYEAGLRAAHGNAGAVGLLNVAVQAPVLAPAPAYAGEALRRGGDAAFRAAALPGSDQVRPEYQQSGQWISEPQ